MKILIVSSYNPGDTSYFVHRALNQLGHEVHIFKWPKVSFVIHGYTLINRIRYKVFHQWAFFRGIFKKQMAEKLVKNVERLNPDLTFVLKGDGIPVYAIKEISERSRIINWFPDALINLKNDIVKSIEYYTHFFVKDIYLKNQLEKIGFSNIEYLPQAFDPHIHKKMEVCGAECRKYNCDIAVVGSQYFYRTKLVKMLIEDGYDIKIWGAGWNKLGRSYSDLKKRWMGYPAIGDEKAKVFGSAKIILNIQHFSEVLGVNKRTFELAGAGVFQITGKTSVFPGQSGLEAVFEPEEEIICFEDYNDLRKKIDYYLKHGNERDVIAKRSQTRAHREHTYKKRMSDVMRLQNE